jgi:hypothetical protein
MKTVKLLALTALLFLAQCTCNRQDSIQTKGSLDSINNDTTEKVSFILPAPEDILADILPEGVKINPQLANPTSNVEKYTITRMQALNLGVYVADFAYLNQSDNKTNALEYFKTIRELAQNLNIYGYFDDSFFNRVTANLTNSDSLITIASEMYLSMSDVLENSNRDEIYALISAGAMVETLYLSAMTVTNYSEYQAIVKSLFDQRYLFDSMHAFLLQNKKDSNVKTVLDILENLKQILDEKDAVEPEKKIIKDKTNHITISGGKTRSFNEEKYNKLKAAIIEARSKIISSSK